MLDKESGVRYVKTFPAGKKSARHRIPSPFGEVFADRFGTCLLSFLGPTSRRCTGAIVMDKRHPSGTILDIFGKNTFNRGAMREKLPKTVFESLLGTIERGEPIDPDIVPAVAHGMKEWAMERGATHYCHWFQPMTGSTAEKHDAFLAFDSEQNPMERFSGSQLIQGEPDASSFPSGGMRTTFEARGYTAWDPSSPAFIMEGPHGATLCIPSIFLSYHGGPLDKKTPLLRSVEALSKAAVRMLRLLGRETSRVVPQAGCEQEYFLVDGKLYERRPDLMVAGRTLLGAAPPKGQQMEDHYFGSIPPRILHFMQDAERELYKLGVPAKTRHNEVAPHQFELAPIYEDVNLAADHNQLVMEFLKKVAARHGLALLLHEKPFAGINGSGKHNNWSLTDAEGNNLFEPGSTPHENLQFLIFLVAALKAVSKRAALLRCSIASAGNDLRLGANEAPPAIISVFLGEQLSAILDHLESGQPNGETARESIDLGISKIPLISRDNTDRNRTSPFAFTGNKFEFRAVPSSMSISIPHTVLATAMAEALDEMSGKLEKALENTENRDHAILSLLRAEIAATRKIRFEGDNYSDQWLQEAERRGLPNLPDTPRAMKLWIDGSTKELFQRYGVFDETDLHSRYQIKLEQYVKQIEIEAALVVDLVEQDILGACFEQQSRTAQSIAHLAVVTESPHLAVQKEYLDRYSRLLSDLITKVGHLKRLRDEIREEPDLEKKGSRTSTDLLGAMEEVRKTADALELQTDSKRWPLPSYLELLFQH